jgi:hypothetical protein
MLEVQLVVFQLVQHSAGDTSITLGGSGTGTLKAGDFIKFANHMIKFIWSLQINQIFQQAH